MLPNESNKQCFAVKKHPGFLQIVHSRSRSLPHSATELKDRESSRRAELGGSGESVHPRSKGAAKADLSWVALSVLSWVALGAPHVLIWVAGSCQGAIPTGGGACAGRRRILATCSRRRLNSACCASRRTDGWQFAAVGC